MEDRTYSRLVEGLSGDGWLLSGGVRISQVAYVIEVREVRTSHNGQALVGTEMTVHLRNHSISGSRWGDQLFTLVLKDQRTITGFLSADGTQLVRTGVLA